VSNKHSLAQETFDALIKASGITVALWDPAESCWQITPGLSACLGLQPEWSVWNNANWSEHLHPEDSFEFAQALQEFVNGHGTVTGNVRLKHQNGSWRWFRSEPVADCELRFIRFIDDTEARQERAALVDSQMRLRSIYEAAPVAIILWSREGRISDWNHMAEALFGHERSDAVGQKLTHLLIAPAEYDNFAASIANAVRKNVVDRVVCRSLTAEGKEIICDWRSVTLRGPKGILIGLMSLAFDITASVAAENALRKARDQAMALSQAKSEFMAVISHELRTPLNGVLGMAQLLEMMVAEDALEFVKAIRESGEGLLAIINGIVAYTNIDARPYDQSIESFVLFDSVALAADRYGHLLQQKGLLFEQHLDEQLRQPVMGDQQSFDMVIRVLLDNAVKFTEKGSISVHLRIEVEDADAALVRFTIKDSGIGIPPDKLDDLYSPFHQGENAIVRKYGGVGLGLSMAKKLMDRMGGSISVDSIVDEGTTVVLMLPFKKTSDTCPGNI
jgi:PAS domain S-box-containing protein